MNARCVRCWTEVDKPGIGPVVCDGCRAEESAAMHARERLPVGGTYCTPEQEALSEPLGSRRFSLPGDGSWLNHGTPGKRKTPPSMTETDANGSEENALRALEDGAVE